MKFESDHAAHPSGVTAGELRGLPLHSKMNNDDEPPFYAPNHPPPAPRQPRRGELLFEFLVGHDRVRCELLGHGELGVEAQFWRNEEFEWSRRFDSRLDPTRSPRELAIAWAEEERKALTKDG